MKAIVIVAVLILVVLCFAAAIMPTAATVVRSTSAKNQMEIAATQTAATAVAGSSQLSMTVAELGSLLQAQMEHDQAMADKIVAAAVSGDVAQTTSSVAASGSLTISVLIFAAIVVIVIIIVLGKK